MKVRTKPLDILQHDEFVLIKKDKLLRSEKETAFISELPPAKQKELFYLLYHAEPGQRELFTRVFLARDKCRRVQDAGMSPQAALLQFAKTKLPGDEPEPPKSSPPLTLEP